MQRGDTLKLFSKPVLFCAALSLLQMSATGQAPAQDQQGQAQSSAQQGAAASSVMPDAQVESNVLKALAGAPELADQNISTTTVYGVVTLSGVVKDEPMRVKAETLASRAPGVNKVVDELTLSTDPSANTAGTNPNLQSDGTMAPSSGAQSGTTPQATSPTPAPLYRRPIPAAPTYTPAPQPYGGQQGGQAVVVPAGSMLRVRINQGFDSKTAQPGMTFDGIAISDVVADGAVAIPRGAAIQGVVANVKQAGNLGGRGEISLQLTQVTLGGKIYPLVTDAWSNAGPDKTAHTVGNTIGLSAIGAMIGAVAGGGPGAAIGAGAGAAAGLGASAASGTPQALIPAEAILTFHLAQPAPLTTISQAEMDRLGAGIPVGGATRLVRRATPAPAPPGYYYGYPAPYPAYPAPYPYYGR
jgi:BON domain